MAASRVYPQVLDMFCIWLLSVSPEPAEKLYNFVVDLLRKKHKPDRVGEGKFGGFMEVESVSKQGEKECIGSGKEANQGMMSYKKIGR